MVQFAVAAGAFVDDGVVGDQDAAATGREVLAAAAAEAAGTSPMEPRPRSFQVPPCAWDTSSITASPCRSAMARMACMSQLTPPKWTVMIAPVRGVMAAWMAVGAML